MAGSINRQTLPGCTTLCFCGFCSQHFTTRCGDCAEWPSTPRGATWAGREARVRRNQSNRAAAHLPRAVDADKVKPLDAIGSGVWRVLDIGFSILESSRLWIRGSLMFTLYNLVWKGDCINNLPSMTHSDVYHAIQILEQWQHANKPRLLCVS